jgi:outer membrane beta-barrel protein
MNRNSLRLFAVLALALSAGAFAQEGEGDLVEKVAVKNRLFTVAGRPEVGANVGFTLLSKLTEHYNFNASFAYNVVDWFGLEVRAGYAYSRHTSLANQIQDDFIANTLPQKPHIDDAADLWQMTANAVVGARFQPIYGKISLMAELPVHFQFYLWAGVGAGYFTMQSLAICAQKTGARSCGAYYTDQKVGPLGSIAAGFRFFTARESKHSIKIEVRDWAWLDSYWTGVVRDSQTSGNPTAGGQLSPNAGITNLAQIDIGYAYIF